MAKRLREKAAARKENADKRPSATAKYVRISPDKVRIVLDIIRGKSYEEALAILKFTRKAACEIFYYTHSQSVRTNFLTHFFCLLDYSALFATAASSKMIVIWLVRLLILAALPLALALIRLSIGPALAKHSAT